MDAVLPYLQKMLPVWRLMLYYRPQRSCEGYDFTGVCHSVHGGDIPACIAGGIPAYLAAGLLGGIPACLAGGIPACLAGLHWGSPGPHPGGKLRGLARGGSPGPHLGGLCIPACTEADPLPGGWLLPRAVHILLECILVFFSVWR